MSAMSVDDIISFVLGNYEGMTVNKNWGETGLFYNPGHKLPKGIYVLTFKEKDGPNDNSSNVNRDGVYRLNLGISKQSFTDLFGYIPDRPKAGYIIDTGHDFSRLDEIMPHPVYGWMSWICVLNPSAATFDQIKPLLAESVSLAIQKYSKKQL